ncbi:RNA polymerase sigma factor [Thermomonas sp.]|uniref:RNA polymerase sigma factor n=1 Tax=Thermomonas sp. TaxID=1971895 RepID=UPI0026119110|nr:RNA polymerase sigma factor [Thermomonas sp.]
MNGKSASAAVDYAALDDAALVARVLAGDREGFRQITQRCNQRLYRVVRGVLRDEADIEDVLQEAYVHGYQHLARFRGEASLATWLGRIALNEAYGRLRRRRATVDIDDMDLTEDVVSNVVAFPGPGAGEDPLASAERSQLRRLLERAIDALPEGFRLVYLLREVEGCSVEETARTLSLREETVKTRLHRARKQLRAALAEQICAASGDAFSFMGERCARITAEVMARIGRLP